MSRNNTLLLLLLACRTHGGIIEDLLYGKHRPADAVPQIHIPQAAQSCYVWCHWDWDLNCGSHAIAQCGACETCKTLNAPRPPPTPPGNPVFEMLEYYAPDLHFEARDGALYANNRFFSIKGLTW